MRVNVFCEKLKNPILKNGVILNKGKTIDKKINMFKYYG